MSMSSHPAVADVRVWNRLSDAEKVVVAEGLSADLMGLGFVGLERQSDSFTAALFAPDRCAPTDVAHQFVLIPGHPAADLGYVPGSFRPSEAMVATVGGADEDVERLLVGQLMPSRRVGIGGLLVQRYPQVCGAVKVGPPSGSTTGDMCVTKFFTTDEDGSGALADTEAVLGVCPCVSKSDPSGEWELREVSHDEVVLRAAKVGLRLPTPDEFEYVHRGGSRSLWHWGDDAPVNQCSGSGPTLNDHSVPDDGPFDAHHGFNGFGCKLSRSSFDVELTSDPTVVMAGDGGMAVTSGVDGLVQWLPLASGFRRKVGSTIHVAPRFRLCFAFGTS